MTSSNTHSQQFTESGLQFSFSPDWIVHSYDQHRFYRYLSGAGMKGVDFVGLYQDHLYLIEVKNYNDRLPLDRYEPMAQLLEKPEDYIEAFYKKFVDSLKLIRIIRRFYRRQWWFRRGFSALQWLLGRRWALRREAGFWWTLAEYVENKEVTYILWLELGAHLPSEEARQLRQNIQAGLAARVADHQMQVLLGDSRTAFLGITSEALD